MRLVFGVIFAIVSLVVVAPFLFRLYGDVILTKMLFQTWCKELVLIC
jgi:hypothetical protein